MITLCNRGLIEQGSYPKMEVLIGTMLFSGLEKWIDNYENSQACSFPNPTILIVHAKKEVLFSNLKNDRDTFLIRGGLL